MVHVKCYFSRVHCCNAFITFFTSIVLVVELLGVYCGTDNFPPQWARLSKFYILLSVSTLKKTPKWNISCFNNFIVHDASIMTLLKKYSCARMEALWKNTYYY